MTIRAALAVSALVLTAAAAPAAAEGVYLGTALGGGQVGDEFGETWDSTAEFKFFAGYRFDRVSVEAWASGSILTGDGCVECWGFDGVGKYGLDVKLSQPVHRNVDVYVRGSMSHISGTAGEGRGLGAGVGVALKGKVSPLGFLFSPLFFVPTGPKIQGAIFIEHTTEFFRMHRDTSSTDALFSNLMIGFAFGKDF